MSITEVVVHRMCPNCTGAGYIVNGANPDGLSCPSCAGTGMVRS